MIYDRWTIFSRTVTRFHPTPKPVIWSYPIKEDKPRLNDKSHHSGPAIFIFLFFILFIDVTPLNHILYNRYRGIEGCGVINSLYDLYKRMLFRSWGWDTSFAFIWLISRTIVDILDFYVRVIKY